MFTKYGYFTIGTVLFIVLILTGVGFYLQNSIAKYSLFSIAFLFLIFTLYFFRDPERTTPQNENYIISPADGTVILIKDVYDNRYLNSEAIQISIFMSPFNVHVNRIPVDGVVEYVKYIKGEYLVASHDKADVKNERNEIGIKSKKSKVLYTQVAGFIARRIVSELKVGDSVKCGDRFGMIKFGSRVDVVVPKNYKIKVKNGDKVTAGKTILFEYANE